MALLNYRGVSSQLVVVYISRRDTNRAFLLSKQRSNVQIERFCSIISLMTLSLKVGSNIYRLRALADRFSNDQRDGYVEIVPRSEMFTN